MTRYYRGYYPLDYNDKEFYVASNDSYYRCDFQRVPAKSIPIKIRKQLLSQIKYGYIKMWAYYPINGKWGSNSSPKPDISAEYFRFHKENYESSKCICIDTDADADCDNTPLCQKPTLECTVCSILDCPYKEPLHYHHDGCPACFLNQDTVKD